MRDSMQILKVHHCFNCLTLYLFIYFVKQMFFLDNHIYLNITLKLMIKNHLAIGSSD